MYVHFCWDPHLQGASWVKQMKRQAPRWTYTDPTKRTKTSLLGRDSCQYLHISAQTAGGGDADLAAAKKEATYSDLPKFLPVAIHLSTTGI